MDSIDVATQSPPRAPVTDRVNVEPAILHGITATEAKVVGLAGLVVCSFIGAVLWGITGVWQTLLVLGTFGPAVIVWIAAGRLAGIKRGRPDGYYNQIIHLWLANRGLTTCKFVRHEGEWSLGRGLEADMNSPMDLRKVKAEEPSQHLIDPVTTAQQHE